MKIKKIEGQDYINHAMMSYSAEVLLNRAIPVLQDGFKPAYRHILTSMYLKNNFHLTKTANVSGNVMKLHPHGSVSGTIIEMVQKDRNLVPLLDGNGNFGQFTSKDIRPAADRYSEVKLNDFAKNQLQNFDKNIVKTVTNYDGTIKVPEVIPVTFPIILMYCTQGIGVGYASQTLSFNMKDIAKLIHGLIHKNKEIIYPDFATGAMIDKDDNSIKEILETGKGRINLRAKIEKKNNYLLITQIPYGEKRENIINKIIKVYQQGKITQIKNIKDLTDIKGLKIKVELQKNANLDDIIQKLYKYTPLQSSISANMNIIDIDDGTPKVMGVYEICKRWLLWRIKCYQKQIKNELEQNKKQYEILSGYKIIQNKLDDVIKIIRKSTKKNIVSNLRKFNLSDLQIKSILNIKLYNLNNTVIKEKIEEIKNVNKKIEELKKLFNDKKQIIENIDKQIINIANKFGGERRTKIAKFNYEALKKVIKQEKRNDESDYRVIVTIDGLIYKLKKDDSKPSFVDIMFDKVVNNNSVIDILCDDRMTYGIRINELKQSSEPNSISQYTDFDNEKILLVFENKQEDELIYGFNNGKMVRIPISNFSLKSRKIRNSFANNIDLVFAYQLQKGKNVNINIIAKDEKHTISSKNIKQNLNRGSVGNFYINKNRNLEINVKYGLEK